MVSGIGLFADQITVHNMTNQNLFVRIYYYQGLVKGIVARDKMDNVLNIVEIFANSQKIIKRPKRWNYRLYPIIKHYDRQLVVATDPRALKKVVGEAEYQKLPQVNIGTLQGSSFYLAKKDEQIRAYNQVRWKVKKPIIEAAEKANRLVKDTVKKFTLYYPAIEQNQYKDEVATITKADIHPDEQSYLDQRLLYTSNALEKLLGREIDQSKVPKIALVASGGGYRAMIGTIGSLIAAQDTGLLDASTWMVSLSGSTWALGSWTTRGISPRELKGVLFEKIKKNLKSITTDEIRLLINMLFVKVAFGQKITVVDLYGGLLANRLFSDFGDERHRIYLSQQAERIKDASWIFPIYTAVRRGIGVPPTWYEFTPYEIGSTNLGLYVPSWAYGRRFLKGDSMDFAPEQSLGYHFGTFGSAFAVTFAEMYEELIAGLSGIEETIVQFIFSKIIKQILGEKRVVKIGQKRIRLSWAEVFNFTRDMLTSPIKDKAIIKLVDAGIEFNLPYPPISGERSKERKADVIIFLDYSGNIVSLNALKKCEKYAQTKGLKFPVIDYSGVAERAVSVFKDESDPKVPVVIYLPLVRDNKLWQKYRNNPVFDKFKKYLDTFNPVQCEEEDFCSTFNFQYDPKQAEQLSAQTEFNLKASIDTIIEAINWVINRRELNSDDTNVLGATADF